MSFLGAALRRLPPGKGFTPPLLLCNNDHRFLVRAETEAAGIEPRAIILEPVARNTAPAITVAALMARRDTPNAVIVVMPSDHVIPDEVSFLEAAVMEHTSAAVMLPLKAGWSDMGSWSSLWEISEHDADGNAVHGDAVIEDTCGCYIHSEKRLVATIGVENLVIVETPTRSWLRTKAGLRTSGQSCSA